MSITLLDGGMGQELIARSVNPATGLWSTQILMDEPQLIYEVHRDYFAAGAEIATTSSYAIHRDRLSPAGIEDRFVELHQKSCQLAVDARDAHGSGLVAGSLGPSGWSYRPDLAPSAEIGANLFAEIARIHAPYVDLLLLETMSSVEQARGSVMGASSVGKPVWLSISVDDNDGTKLRSGEAVADILPLAREFNVAALLVNCSMPEAVTQALNLLSGHGIPTGGYANGFTNIADSFKEAGSTVDALESRTDLGPQIYADFVDGWIGQGATIVGGCCEVGPAHISELARRFK